MGEKLTKTHGRKRLTLVFVLDGLRPEFVTSGDTPTLFRLRDEGVCEISQTLRSPGRILGECLVNAPLMEVPV